MSAQQSYARVLDAIGLYLERANAGDVLVNEINGGFLLSFVADGEQRVVTFDALEMGRLQSDAVRHQVGKWTGPPGRRASLRVRLQGLGRYLDERGAAAILAQERAHGFSTEFTGLPHGHGDAVGPARLYETLDDRRLRALSGSQDTS
jgi:hypothetical protein